MDAFFDFEKPIVNLEKKLTDLRELARQEGVDFSKEIAVLETKVSQLIDETYAKLSPWQKVQLSRHPGRPYTRDYIDLLFPDFMELQGDRAYGDDQAILGGVATWPPVAPGGAGVPGNGNGAHGERFPVLILGHQKGRTTKQKMERNFGMARPEGYRKAMRLMQLADRAKMPILTFIDTPGAYPGLEAEERGQSQAIAESIHVMFSLGVPIASVVIGEGGSGGALAIGVGNLVLMQEYSTYSVISPESCASILWSDSSLAERASERLKMNPPELLKMGIIDSVIPEPKGGAHRDWNEASRFMREALLEKFGPMVAAYSGGAETPALAAVAMSNGKGAKAGKAPAAKAGKSAKAAAPKAGADVSASAAATATAAAAPGKLASLADERMRKFRAMGGFALAHAPGAGASE